jgi:Lon protease-like protein
MSTGSHRLQLPLFPLHSVLFPGVALPLHIFEERYRQMVGDCIERGEPFGVVLIKDGREVGGGRLSLADVGTTAVIRKAGRYPDGKLDILTIGARRFRIDEVAADREPYLVGDVEILEEPVGERTEARRLGTRIGRRFLRYLELLAPALAGEEGPEIDVEVEVEIDDEATGESDDVSNQDDAAASFEILGTDELVLADGLRPQLDAAALSDEQRHRLLLAAAKRLTSTSDPTVLSYVITGLVQVELGIRQNLLEAPDTVSRLTGLDAVLVREIQLLSRHLKPLVLDPAVSALRRN